jgi:hypothetical protein
MNRFGSFCSFFGAIALASQMAWAEMKGSDLNAACTSAADSPGSQRCIAYIGGLMDGLFAAELQAKQGTPICAPDHTNIDQVREMLVQFFKSNQAATVIR